MKIKTIGGIIIYLLLSSTTVFATQPVEWASGIKLTPAQPQEGDQVAFQMSVRTAENINHFKVVGFLDNKQIFARKYAVKAGANRNLRFNWKATKGDHLITFRVIPSEKTADNDGRQTPVHRQTKDPLLIRKQFTVAAQPVEISPLPVSPPVQPLQIQQPVCEGRPLPDLVAEHPTVSGTGQPGSEHSISVGVSNRGQCDSGPFTIRLEVTVQVPDENIFQTREIGTKSVHSLPPCRGRYCEESQVLLFFNYTLLDNTFAQYDFTVEVDNGDHVEEFNEENNVIERSGTIKVLPSN